MRIGRILRLTLAGLVLPATALAGALSVVPVRVELGSAGATAVLRVKNEGPAAMPVQVSTKTWSQDTDGGAVYDDTSDLVVFPKLLTIEAGEERIVRVAYRGTGPSDVERTYRLFVEELPISEGPQSGVTMTLRLGVPVFVAPSRARPEPVLKSLDLEDGTLKVTVENRGNAHVAVGRIAVVGRGGDGAKRLEAGSRGWYILAGRSRTFPITLPEADCRASRVIELSADTGGTTLSGRLEVDAARCASAP